MGALGEIAATARLADRCRVYDGSFTPLWRGADVQCDEREPVLRLTAWSPPLSRPRKEAMRHGSAALQASRLESLRNSLLESIDMLRRRRANEIPQGDLDDYVSLDWIEWHGGTLRLTVVGENIRRQLIRQAPRPA